MNWTPYPLEKPEHECACLVTIEDCLGRIVEEATFVMHPDGDGYFMACDGDEWFVLTGVTAWMPYPKPYDPQQMGRDILGHKVYEVWTCVEGKSELVNTFQTLDEALEYVENHFGLIMEDFEHEWHWHTGKVSLDIKEVERKG